jgi:tetratricopeptide (TPR) repeat protein
MAGAYTPVEVLCCYAHADESWLRRLETHLSMLQRQGIISLWHDRLLVPGTDWAKSLDAHLETASVILLLVSADFLASDYCYSIEMKRALERQEAGEARVVPILVRPADWRSSPLAHLSALPSDAKPISSWQNKDTALTEVAVSIRRVIVEELPQISSRASQVVLPSIWNVPYSRNPFFVGRAAELVQLHQDLQSGQATAFSQPQAISGLGGIGKTQLALEYAYRYRQDYQVVLWTHAESTEALVSSFLAIATLLHLPEQGAKEQDITVQAVKSWLQTHRNWLLILDNADDLTLLPDFLPPNLGGHELLTTRAAATGRLANRLDIKSLLPEQGALFLLRRATRIATDAVLERASQEEQDLALQITQELGGLPLALDQAGAYLEETGMDLSSYQQIYRQYRAVVLRERRGLMTDYPLPVATTWSASIQRVDDRNPAATKLLQILTFLSPDAIPEEILTTGASQLGPELAPVAADVLLFNQAIEALRAYSLLLRDPKRKTLSIHRVVQAVLQDQLSDREQHTWAKRTVLAVNATFPQVEHDTWEQCERLLLQALNAAQVIEQYQILSEEAGRLLHETATYLMARGHSAEAELLFQQALRIREQLLGPEHLDVAHSLHSLANLYLVQGKYMEAESLFQQALRIREQLLGPEHPDIAHSLNLLAGLYCIQGKYTEAKSLFQQALRIREQLLGPEHLDVAYSLNSLANLYLVQGKYTEAEPFFQRTLRIRKQQLTPEHPLVARSLNNLANLYRVQGKYTEAESLFQQALRIQEQQLGPEHPDLAYPLNGLANLYREQRKYAEAESLYQQALEIWKQQLGQGHCLVTYPLNNLANLYCNQGKYAAAEPLYQRALHIRKQHLGPKHPETVVTMYDFARFWEMQGNSEEAKVWYSQALMIREQTLGMHHPKTIEIRRSFIALLHSIGQHQEAVRFQIDQPEQ